MNPRGQGCAIAAIGDAADPACWSGIPYHFWQATLRQGWNSSAVRLPLQKARGHRLLWNARQVLRGRGSGGFQYSEAFADWAWPYFPAADRAPDVLSFHPFIPPISRLHKAGGAFSLYFDATHPLMFARYGLGQSVSAWMAREILEKERRIFAEAERLVFFQRWAAESAVRGCGANQAKVHVILPGANLEPAPAFKFKGSLQEIQADRSLSFGYVGKDWRRKGFPKLLAVVEALNRMGVKVTLSCIGLIPDDARHHPLVRYHGLLDKGAEHQKIVDLMASCDLGCLLSEVDASSISILEFLRVGVPVMATMVDGMGDLVPPDAGFRIAPDTAPETIAAELAPSLRSAEAMWRLRTRARQWAQHVTWDRCVQEWDELLRTGKVARPVRPWLGLPEAGGMGHS